MQKIPTTKAGKVACAAWLLIFIANAALVSLPFFIDYNFFHTDTWSYFSDTRLLFSGQPGLYRTPLYLLYIKACISPFGEAIGYRLIIILQTAVYLWATIYVYRLARRCCPWAWLAIGAMLVFGLFPAILFYNIKIIAESFVISLMVFLAWWTLRAIWERSQRAAIFATIIIATLLGLKPIFIFLVPLYLCTWIWLSIKIHRFLTAILLCIALACCSFGYTKCMEQTYGAPIISYVSIANDYYTVVEAGAMHPDSLNDPELRKYFSARHAVPDQDLFLEIFDADPTKFNLSQLQQEIHQAKLDNPDKMASLYYKRILTMGNSTWYPWSNIFFRKIFKHTSPLIWLVYLTIIVAPFVCWRYRHTDYPMFMFSATLWAIITSHIIVLILGAMFDWGRLMSPVFPLWILLLLITITHITKIASNINFKKHKRIPSKNAEDTYHESR